MSSRVPALWIATGRDGSGRRDQPDTLDASRSTAEMEPGAALRTYGDCLI